MTGPRRWRLRRCLADCQLPGTRSGRPRKRTPLGLRPCRGEPKPKLARHQLRPCTDGARSSYDPQVTDRYVRLPPLFGFSWHAISLWQSNGRRDWANLTTEFIEDIAGRLLSLDVSEYLRFRAVCKPWRVLTEDPRERGVLDSRFRPGNWFPLSKQVAAPFHLCLRNRVTDVTVGLNHPEFPASHYLSLADGLLVLCDKATYAVRVLHPLTGALTEFPDITDVWDRIGAGPDARVAMDAF
ncbi:hypothetical protein ACQ4PT_059165 [Festuca glaucescens]